MKPLIRAAVPAVILAATLTACSGDDSNGEASGECRDYSAGSVSDSVSIEGEFGEANPTVTFDTPLEASGLERTIVDEGDGEVTAPGEILTTFLTVVNGTTGETAVSESINLTVADTNTLEAFSAAIECVPVGSRVVTVEEASTVYGEEGNPGIGVNPDDTLVIVADVVEVNEPVPAEEWTENVPDVTFDEDGVPEVTLPDGDAPEDIRVAILEEGDGEVVADGDFVRVMYQGTSWENGEIFDQNYGADPIEFGTREVVEGFRSALVGQTVGTTLVVSMPPEYAYGEDPSGHELAGQTLLFVVEILADETEEETPSEQ